MPAGLYGKLPAKRDFIAANTPRRFLEVWEPWLHASLATSRQVLGEAWRDAFLSAPIWRFWLGAGFCGDAVLGAFMPSVDGVGRYSPLTIFVDEREGVLPPPEIEPNEAWFEAAETILLDALQPERSFDETISAVADLQQPICLSAETSLAGMTELPSGAILVRDFRDEVGLAFRAARRFGHRQAFAGQSCWWTTGGQGFPATALLENGLPPPDRFAQLLTGEFEPAADAPA